MSTSPCRRRPGPLRDFGRTTLTSVPSVPLIPRRVLFGEPAYTSPSLSPSGDHLAYLAPYKDRLNVWLGGVSDRDFRPLTDLDGGPIEDYVWARDGRHLLYLTD